MLVKATLIKNAPRALQLNLYAHTLWPYSQKIRLQLPLTFQTIMATRMKDLRVAGDAALRIHRIGLSAGPAAVSTLHSRLDYLVNFPGSMKARGEIEAILSLLRLNAKWQLGTWLHEANIGLNFGDRERAKRAIDRGREISRFVKAPADLMKQFDKMESEL